MSALTNNMSALTTYVQYRETLEAMATRAAPAELYYELQDSLSIMSDGDLLDFITLFGG